MMCFYMNCGGGYSNLGMVKICSEVNVHTKDWNYWAIEYMYFQLY